MYVVIQKIMRKKPNPHGAYKEIKVEELPITMNGVTKVKYCTRYEGERFERPHREAYKISVHQSYRVNGKVQKKQVVITTIDYYTLIEFGLWDCMHFNQHKLELLELTAEELYDMIYEKMEPIIDEITAEFEQSEEYKAKQKQDEILKKHIEAREAFEKIYGGNTYEYCYDVYGVLRNEKYLNELKANHKAQQEYQNRSYYDYSKGNYNSGYHGQSNGNYSNYDYSSFFQPAKPQYSESDKPKLKKIIRTLTKAYHPDVGGDPEVMKLVNRLKDEWGV